MKDFAFAKFGDFENIYTIHNNIKIIFWSMHTGFLIYELYYKGIINLKRLGNRIIVHHNLNKLLLPLKVQ